MVDMSVKVVPKSQKFLDNYDNIFRKKDVEKCKFAVEVVHFSSALANGNINTSTAYYKMASSDGKVTVREMEGPQEITIDQADYDRYAMPISQAG